MSEIKNSALKVQDTGNKMAEGSSWLTFGSMASRILGAVYIIFWMRWMGDPVVAAGANALFNIGYTYYAYFLDFSTGGVPAAISERIAFYNSKEEYETSKSLYSNAMKLMLASGFVFAVLLYLLAPILANQSAAADPNEATLVIRSLTPAILVLPAMSVTRGFFQGHSNMAPPAISQVIEQLARVIFMLASVYIIRKIMDGPVITAVTFSTFAAFVGALAASVYLFWKMRTTVTVLDADQALSQETQEISTKEILKDIVITAIPFILISTGISFAQIIDQNTFAPILEYLTSWSPEEIQVISGETIANPVKIITILVSLGAAMGSTAVPIISDLKAQDNLPEIGKQINNSMQLLMFVMIPGAIGLWILAEPIYGVFYGPSVLGVQSLKIGAIYSITTASVVMLANIMKAAGLARQALIILFLGIFMKLLVQFPMMVVFGPAGIYCATAWAFLFVGLSYLYILYEEIGFNVRHLVKRLLLILIFAIIMGIVVYLGKTVLYQWIRPDSFLKSIFLTGVLALLGVLVYAYLTLKSRLAEALLGQPAKKIRKKLKI